MGESHARGSETQKPQCDSAREVRGLILRAILILNGIAILSILAFVLMPLQWSAALMRAAAMGFFLACLGVAFALVGGLFALKNSEASERARGGASLCKYAFYILLAFSLLSFILATAALARGFWLSPAGFPEDQGAAASAAVAPGIDTESPMQAEVEGSASPLWYLVLDVVIGTFIAIGTISVAILAIFGGPIAQYLFGPELRLETVDHKNEPDCVSEDHDWYWHLRVRNSLPSSAHFLMKWLPGLRKSPLPATNCRVRLRRFERLQPDGTLCDESFVVPLQYCWPFSGATEAVAIAAEPARSFRQVVNYDLVDFGKLDHPTTTERKQVHFSPLLYDASEYSSKASLKPGDIGRYYLEIISDQFTSRVCQVFEVRFSKNGWTEDKDEIRRRLTIKDVTDTNKEESTNGATI